VRVAVEEYLVRNHQQQCVLSSGVDSPLAEEFVYRHCCNDPLKPRSLIFNRGHLVIKRHVGINSHNAPAYLEDYAKLSLKKYRPIAARNEDEKVFKGLL
jgi:hypothetical protein